MSWVWSLIARVATALWDRWRTEQASRARGASEERERALREAERQEELGRQVAEEAARMPLDRDDGFRRD